MQIDVSLDLYQSKYMIALEKYCLAEEQLMFTSLPLEVLAQCQERTDYHPVVILVGTKPVGFFVLHGWEGVQDYSDNKQAILLRAYSIQREYQGMGIGTASLQLLVPFIKENFSERDEIILGVNHKNLSAQHVYQKAGFIDKGSRVMGRKGELIILHKAIV